MWKWHPDNVRKSTWDILVASMREAVKIADRHEVTLAFEPEHNNVVNSVARARMLLDEIDSPWLKVVIDPANLMRVDDFPRMSEVLDEAFDWLGPDIVLAHAKNPPGVQSREDMIPVLEYLQRIDPARLAYEILLSQLNKAGKLPDELEREALRRDPEPGARPLRILYDL